MKIEATSELLAALFLAGCPAIALAGLGNAPAALKPRLVASEPHAASSTAASYTTLRKTLDSGTEVHEYVDAAGTVFAVAWSGPYLPDLKELLGTTTFQSLASHAPGRPRGPRAQLTVERDDLVVVSRGRMGAFEGRAWLPRLLPAGFSPADVQ